MLESFGEPQVFETGTLLAGRYEVVGSIGSGGMGWVVHVIDRALDRKSVALKLLYPHLMKDERAFARFRNEVLLAQDLSHPNIVRIHDLGVTERNQYFISMEYVHGTSLKDLLSASGGGWLPFEDAIRILYELAKGVAHAHRKGIIHRDLKPDNVLISKLGEVKIVDFGIARSLWQENGLTKTGGAVGTPYYMAPEQIRGEALDERCDIYSMGIMAYELVVGRPPFDDECFYTLAQMHIGKELPLVSAERPGTPAWFDEFVRLSTAKNRDERLPSVQRFAELLEPHLSSHEGLRSRTRALVTSAAELQPPRFSLKRRRLPRLSAAGYAWCFFCFCVFVVLLATLRNNDSWKAVVGSQILKLEQASGLSLGLLKDAAAIDIRDGGPEDLFEAIRQSRKFYVKLIVLAGNELNARDASGKTALHHAVLSTDSGVLGELLEGELELNVLDNEGVTPLLESMRQQDSARIERLLSLGADPNVGRLDGAPVLHHLVRRGNEALVEALFRISTPDLSLTDSAGNTAVHIAVRYEQKAILERLIAAGAPLDTRNQSGETALFRAVQEGSMDLAEVLIAAGAAVNIPDADGQQLEDVAAEPNLGKLRALLRSAKRTSVDR